MRKKTLPIALGVIAVLLAATTAFAAYYWTSSQTGSYAGTNPFKDWSKPVAGPTYDLVGSWDAGSRTGAYFCNQVGSSDTYTGIWGWYNALNKDDFDAQGTFIMTKSYGQYGGYTWTGTWETTFEDGTLTGTYYYVPDEH